VKRLAFLLIYLTVILLSHAGADDKKLLFHVSFNKGLDADFSRGNGKATCNDEAFTFVESIYGKAVKINYLNLLRYETENNINPQHGTIEMWVKPLIYSQNQGIPQCDFFSAGDMETIENKLSDGILRQVSYKDKLTIFSGFPVIRNPYPVRTYEGLSDLNANLALENNKTFNLLAPLSVISRQWTHIAFSWGKTEKDGKNIGKCRLYRNGKLVAELPLPEKWSDSFGKFIFIGKGNARSNGIFLIDELKIYDTALDASQVEKLYSGE